MTIIPAIDIINGSCVRLTQGDYNRQTTYNEHPLEVARRFEAAGITHLHMVDLDGARAGSPQNLDVIRTVARETNLIIDAGGGIRTSEAVSALLDAGVAQITAGSIAVSNPELVRSWIQTFGPERIVLGADVRNGMLATEGWKNQSEHSVFDCIDYFSADGLTRVICTDISKDGMLAGPALELYASLLRRFPNLELIASGGVSSADDVRRLKELGCTGVIVGKALYEGKVMLEEIQELC